MTPKEKADELFKEFMHYVDDSYNEPKDLAISCALIVVDEIFSVLRDNMKSYDSKYSQGAEFYWIEVKEEIEKL